jgi:ribosomal protein L12E/L44/L45/RPP1/RPP2
MRYIAAYLLLQIGGNGSPSAADIKKVLQAVGIECDDERLDSLLSELGGKDINAVRFLSLLSYKEVNVVFHSLSPRALAS